MATHCPLHHDLHALIDHRAQAAYVVSECIQLLVRVPEALVQAEKSSCEVHVAHALLVLSLIHVAHFLNEGLEIVNGQLDLVPMVRRFVRPDFTVCRCDSVVLYLFVSSRLSTGTIIIGSTFMCSHFRAAAAHAHVVILGWGVPTRCPSNVTASIRLFRRKALQVKS